MQADEGSMMVRPESPQDYTAIDEVNRAAFGQDNEARLVARLRESAGFDPGLSLVAVRDGVIVGHILFSPIVIASEADEVPALALAPIAVLPARQREGIGSQLVREGLAACRQAGHPIVIVVGHPDYYPRFGFTRAGPLGLRAPLPVPDEAFMALALVPGELDGVRGTVRYPPPFEEV
jgi:putative acetyltransferase